VDRVRSIADAVLYEGYLLWPYRQSALKNQRRWTIGGVYPRPYAEHADDHWTVYAEFVMETAPAADIEVTLRFLQEVHRQVMDGDTPVERVRLGDETFTTWQEARERELTTGRIAVGRLLDDVFRLPVAIAAGAEDERIDGDMRFTRSWGRVDGWADVSAAPAGDGAVRVRIEVANTADAEERAEAVRAGMLCAHVVAHTGGGAFVSPTDPPEALAEAVAACGKDGLWPVLAGRPGSHDTVLAAPIVLYDWPQVAAESPGDLFDGTEIDRLLILSVLSLTEEERREMAATDPKAREILERCGALSAGELIALHGTMRDPRRDVW
jgi:hydrogenase maturation protease